MTHKIPSEYNDRNWKYPQYQSFNLRINSYYICCGSGGLTHASTNGVYADEMTVLVTLPLDVLVDTEQHRPLLYFPKRPPVYQEWSVPCFSTILWQQVSFGCSNSAVISSHSSPLSYEALQQPRRQGLVIFRKQARHVVIKSINQTAMVWTFSLFHISYLEK